jgi:hypothetical protein
VSRRLPIYFADDITQGEIAQALHDAGLHLHTEAGTRMVVDRVPAFLRRDTPATNVVPIERKRRRQA